MTGYRSLLPIAIGVLVASNTAFSLRRGYFNVRGARHISRRMNPYHFWIGISLGLLVCLFLFTRAVQILLGHASA
jgi:hypothetical protein